MAGTEPSAERARLLIELAVQVGDTRVERGIAMAKEAESMARTLGDADVLGFVLLGARHIGRHPTRLEEHLHRAVELEQLGQRSGSLALMLGGLNAQALLHLERGELSASFERSDRFFRLLDGRHLPFFQITARIQRATRAVLDGDLECAEALAMETVRLAKDINHPPMTWAASTLANIRASRPAMASPSVRWSGA